MTADDWLRQQLVYQRRVSSGLPAGLCIDGRDSADLVFLTKADLLPHLADMGVQSFEGARPWVMHQRRLLVLSARNNQGMEEWQSWLGISLANLHGHKSCDAYQGHHYAFGTDLPGDREY